jgi:large subunit ribosomal protein L4
MVEFNLFDHQKNVSASIELDDSVFNADINDAFLHQVLVSYEANKRQGTHKTLNRNEVSGTKKKPFRQKGTGRARQGTWRSPHHYGGATQFGPTPRSYRKEIPKKMKQEAFRQCLSLKAKNDNCFILADLEFSEIKTKMAAQILDAFEAYGNVLFIDAEPTANAMLSIRNLGNASILPVNSCSPYDLFRCDTIILSKAAAELYQERYAKAGGQSNEE